MGGPLAGKVLNKLGVPMVNPLKALHGAYDVVVNGEDYNSRMRDRVFNPKTSMAEDTQVFKALGNGFIEPMKKSWEQGKPVEAITQGVLEAASWFVGAGEAKTASKLGEAGKLASEAEKAATIADKASDASKATKLAEGAEATKVGQKTAAAEASKTDKTSKSKLVSSEQTTLKTGSKKHKAKSNAETDHSPASKSDAQHSARGQDESFGKSETTNSLTNLGKDFSSHNSSVLKDFTPVPNPTRSNQTIFSGVFDPKTNTFLTKPSGSTKLSNGGIPEDLVQPRGGHREIQSLFSETNPNIDTSQTVGFTIYYREKGRLDVAFFSRGINSNNFKELKGYAPEHLQEAAVKSLNQSTGLEVQIIPRLDLPD
jgi:hypothetical protein